MPLYTVRGWLDNVEALDFEVKRDEKHEWRGILGQRLRLGATQTRIYSLFFFRASEIKNGPHGATTYVKTSQRIITNVRDHAVTRILVCLLRYYVRITINGITINLYIDYAFN